MPLAIGTFNLNNLFSRFDFEADLASADASLTERTTFRFSDPAGYRLRTYQGRLVRGKPAAERALLVERIRRIDLDVLAVQEVEDVDTLRAFVRDDLGGLYPHVVLVEGDDPRLIDVGLLSKLPLGGITSWQATPDPADPARPLFSRDLLQVEVLRRDLVPLSVAEPWVARIASAASSTGSDGRHDPFLDSGNAEAFLRALYLQLAMGPQPPAIRSDLLLVLVDTLRRTNPHYLGAPRSS